MAAQLPDHEVDVILDDGEPALRVRTVESSATAPADELDARLTLRLPGPLKRGVEDAAGDTGDSVNSWVVRDAGGPDARYIAVVRVTGRAARKTASGDIRPTGSTGTPR